MMEIENIQYHTSGFLKDVGYHANMKAFLGNYKDKFGNAESLVVHLDETPYHSLGRMDFNPINFLEDGKKVVIKFASNKNYNRNGIAISSPSADEIYISLTFLLDRAVYEYSQMYKPN